MSTHFFRIAIRIAASMLAPVSAVIPTLVQAQSAGDIVILGNSPEQQARFQAYWNELLNLNTPKTQSGEQSFAPAAPDPQLLEKEIIRNLRVSSLQLKPIVSLGGSSEVIGSLTSSNKKPVTVVAVNYEITDAAGKVIQTGSARPQPSTIAPGQTVTFRDQLLTTSARGGNKGIRLSNPAFVIQDGV